MKCRGYQKLIQYLHVYDMANKAAQNSVDYDKPYKIHPVLNMVWGSFAKSYKPGQNQTIDKGMIAYNSRLSYVQYVPAKPIKRRIKVWMHCEGVTSNLH